MLAASIFLAALAMGAAAQSVADLKAGKEAFEVHCGSCHGGDGRGGEYAPDIVTPGVAIGRGDDTMRDIVRRGLPDRGMPAISISGPALTQLLAFFASLTRPAADSPVQGNPDRGADLFRNHGCGGCHARGPENRVLGPGLARIGSEQTLDQIRRSVADPDASIVDGYGVVEIRMLDGTTVEGFARNRSGIDLQLQTFDGQFRFVALADTVAVTEREGSLMPTVALEERDSADLVAFLSRQDGSGELASRAAQDVAGEGLTFDRILYPTPGEWPTYNGRLDGNRHSLLDQINAGNVRGLEISWIYPLDSPNLLETTPVVADGVMYVTFANEVHALDATHGRRIWRYSQPRTPGILGAAARAANRGVALLGKRLFVVTDHAHLLAIDRLTGHKLWDTEMADYRQNYNATMAPLIVKDLVISGTGLGALLHTPQHVVI